MHNKGAEENHRPNLNWGYLCIRHHEEGVLGPEWWMRCEEEAQPQQPRSRSEQRRDGRSAMPRPASTDGRCSAPAAGPPRQQFSSARLLFAPQTKTIKAWTLLSKWHRPPDSKVFARWVFGKAACVSSKVGISERTYLMWLNRSYTRDARVAQQHSGHIK